MNKGRKPHIVMILYGSLPVDVRVDREVRLLTKKNINITILDTDLGYGDWRSCEGATRIPFMKLHPKKRMSFQSLLRFWYFCLKYLWNNRQSIDVVHAHDLTGLPPSWVITSLVPRIKFVYDSHELFPEAGRDRMSVWHYFLFLSIEMICAKRIDYLISVSPVILRKIAKRVGGIPVLLMNVPDLKRIEDILGKLPLWSPRSETSSRRIVYSGGVLHRRGYDELVYAAKQLKEEKSETYEFWIIGDGDYFEHVKSLVKSLELVNEFVFTGRVEFEELLERTSQCDLAVCLYSEPMAHLGMSNKLFEYMMLGIPFLYPNAKQSLPILNKIGVPIVDNPIDVENLVDTIERIFEDPERMKSISVLGRKLVLERFNWHIESKKLILLYENLIYSKEINPTLTEISMRPPPS